MRPSSSAPHNSARRRADSARALSRPRPISLMYARAVELLFAHGRSANAVSRVRRRLDVVTADSSRSPLAARVSYARSRVASRDAAQVCRNRATGFGNQPLQLRQARPALRPALAVVACSVASRSTASPSSRSSVAAIVGLADVPAVADHAAARREARRRRAARTAAAGGRAAATGEADLRGIRATSFGRPVAAQRHRRRRRRRRTSTRRACPRARRRTATVRRVPRRLAVRGVDDPSRSLDERDPSPRRARRRARARNSTPTPAARRRRIACRTARSSRTRSGRSASAGGRASRRPRRRRPSRTRRAPRQVELHDAHGRDASAPAAASRGRSPAT